MKYLMVFLSMTLFLVGTVCSESKTDTNAEGKGKVEKSEYTKRNADNPEIAIDTDYGIMKLELYRDVAPGHVDSMLSRIREGFYDGLVFHRIVDGFMIQGGDPKGNGTGNAGYYLKAEFSDVPHKKGTLSMARAQDPNSASCQFFICLAPAPFLDGKYTVFGQLMEGYDALEKIGKVETVGSLGGEKSKPKEPVFIRKMTILTEADKEAGK